MPKDYILKVYSLKGLNRTRKVLERGDTIYQADEKVLNESDFMNLEGHLKLEKSEVKYLKESF
jgi:hypothetical protein